MAAPAEQHQAFGRFERIDVRDVWISEPADFTPWLAQEANVTLLGDAIGIDLEVEAQEKWVGPFRADILCKDCATDAWVLIENQLERTDHGHLGQLLTYAAGLDAATIVWVAATFTEEHRAALDWLNEITDERFNFFGLEIEAWRICDSPVAPKFNIVSKPNGWSKTVAQTAKSLQETSLSPTKQLQREYWAALKVLIDGSSKIIRAQKPLPQHWTNFAIGKSGFHLTALVNTLARRIGVHLVIDHPDAKNHFDRLEQFRDVIHGEVECELQWQRLPEHKESRIERWLEQADPSERDDWGRQHEWIVRNLESFSRAFAPRVRESNSIQ